ncbi:MAG: hypothetical protein AAGD07_24725 [Planctomycetota bacterium]
MPATKQALGLGLELCCVMPFVRNELDKHFGPPTAISDGAKDELRNFLARAEAETALTQLESDGVCEHASQAYVIAGRVVRGFGSSK